MKSLNADFSWMKGIPKVLVAITLLLTFPSMVSAQAQVWNFQVKGPKKLFSKATPPVVGTARIMRQPLDDGTVSVQENYDLPLMVKQNNNAAGGHLITVSLRKSQRIVIQRQATEDQQGHLLAFQETVKDGKKVVTKTTYNPQSREFVVNYLNFIGRPATKRVPVPQQAYSDTYRRALLINPYLNPLGNEQENRIVFAGFHCKPYDVTHAEAVLHRGRDIRVPKEIAREEMTCKNVAQNAFGTMQRYNNIGNGWCETAIYTHDGKLNGLTIFWKGYDPIFLEHVVTQN